jgi:CRP/FNR family transcriptional regulator, dissimilatory nitrate respiration regulator
MDNIKNCQLFNGLTISQIGHILGRTTYRVRKFGKDDLIALAGTEVDSLLILADGSVRGEMTDDSGKTVKIEDIESPSLLAPAFLFGQQNQFPVTIIANKPSSVMYLLKHDFLKLMQSEPLILSNFLCNISNRAQFLSGKLKFLAFHTIKGKLAHFFLQVSKKTGKDEFVLPKSQNELSEMFGVARPSLSRSIRELHHEGLVLAEGKKIKILNREGLLKLMR